MVFILFVPLAVLTVDSSPLLLSAAPLLLLLLLAVLLLAACGRKRNHRSSSSTASTASATGNDDDELYEESTESDVSVRKGGVLYDADGNRRPFDYMCHHCGVIMPADVVVWAPIGGARVSPWRAFVEQEHTGKTYYINETSINGVNCVSACAKCAALSNDAVRYVPPPDVARRAEESMRRYRREKDLHMAEKAAAKAAADAGASPLASPAAASPAASAAAAAGDAAAAAAVDSTAKVSPRRTPRRDEPIYVPGADNDSVIIANGDLKRGGTVAKKHVAKAHAPQQTYDRVVLDQTNRAQLPRRFVFSSACDESDIDFRDIDREAAQAFIESAPPGAYVVRPSTQAECLSMAYYDVEAGKVKHVLLTHEQRGWITTGVNTHFPSLTALRDHILIAYRFNEPGINFQPLDRAAAEEAVRNHANGLHYLVRPSSVGDLCLTVLLTTGDMRHVILDHEPAGWRAKGLDGGPFVSVKALLRALPAEFGQL